MTQQPTTQTIWAQLSGDLRRFIRRRVADDHAADDLLQETFVRIHRHVDALDDADRLAAWVYRIARNVIHDLYRKSGRDVPLGETEPEAQRDEAAACSGCNGGWVEPMIGELPDSYRDAVRLAEIEGLTQQQIADRLGLSLSGAKSRVQRGRAKFRAVLEQCCRFELDRRGNVLEVLPRSDCPACRDCDG